MGGGGGLAFDHLLPAVRHGTACLLLLLLLQPRLLRSISSPVSCNTQQQHQPLSRLKAVELWSIQAKLLQAIDGRRSTTKAQLEP